MTPLGKGYFVYVNLSCERLHKGLLVLTLIVYVLSLSKLETVLAKTVGGPLNGEP